MALMSVTLDVSKLSGWLNARANCRVERRAYDAGRGVGRETGERGPAAAHERHARREGPAVKAGGAMGVRGAHGEHVAHVRDAGRVEAQRLVERQRGLPSRKQGVRCRARCGLGGGRAWAGGSARAACTARGAAAVKAEGARACAERTLNMPSMSVTLDVSKLSGWLNARANCRVESRVYDAERGVGWEAGGRGPAAAHERHTRREGPAVKAEGARACAER
eukprot:scaffold93232_cov57-Phaeocystis_antarctica.AAC.3